MTHLGNRLADRNIRSDCSVSCGPPGARVSTADRSSTGRRRCRSTENHPRKRLSLLVSDMNRSAFPMRSPPHQSADSESSRVEASWGDLHDRAIDGEPMALEAIVARGLPYLCSRLRCAFRQLDEDLLNRASVDALMDYVHCPKNFPCAPGETLDHLLYRAAWRNARDLLRGEARRHKREKRYVKEAAQQTSPGSCGDTALQIPADIRGRTLESAATIAERQATTLWLNGERRTARLAEALGLSVLSMADQRVEVKRFKDRLLKRVVRLGHRRK